MKCPYCDSILEDSLRMPTCPRCGGILPERTVLSAQREISKGGFSTKGNTSIPTSGGYLAVGGSVVLSDSAVSICVKGFFKKHRTWIPYDQLVKVIYLRPDLYTKRNGALLFRGECNKTLPIPDTRQLFADRSAVALSVEQDTLFYHIFQMLKVVAPKAEFEMIVPLAKIKGLEEMTKAIDVDDFYNRYAPHRDRAASGIRAKYEIPLEAARAMVNDVFDERQRLKYAADPLDAIRDLNLVVEDMRNAERRENRADAERRERREQEAVKASLERIETELWLARRNSKGR